jgi:hypothetical protein
MSRVVWGVAAPLTKKKNTKLLMSMSEVVCVVSLDTCLDVSEESISNYYIHT